MIPYFLVLIIFVTIVTRELKYCQSAMVTSERAEHRLLVMASGALVIEKIQLIDQQINTKKTCAQLIYN